MWPGVGPQTSGSRWGDYTRTEVDPSDGISFWHINQYAQSGDWHTRIGKFNFGATPTPTPTPGPITLSAAGRKVNGINTVRLTWSGATSANIDVFRNSVLITTVPNTGTYTDSTGDTGRARYRYMVCEAGTQTCSNQVTVTFRR